MKRIEKIVKIDIKWIKFNGCFVKTEKLMQNGYWYQTNLDSIFYLREKLFDLGDMIQIEVVKK